MCAVGMGILYISIDIQCDAISICIHFDQFVWLHYTLCCICSSIVNVMIAVNRRCWSIPYTLGVWCWILLYGHYTWILGRIVALYGCLILLYCTHALARRSRTCVRTNVCTIQRYLCSLLLCLLVCLVLLVALLLLWRPWGRGVRCIKFI